MAYTEVQDYKRSEPYKHNDTFWVNDETKLNAENMNELTKGLNAVVNALVGVDDNDETSLDARVSSNRDAIDASEKNITELQNFVSTNKSNIEKIGSIESRVSNHEKTYGATQINLANGSAVIQADNGTVKISGSTNSATSVRVVGDLVVSEATNNSNVTIKGDGTIEANEIKINSLTVAGNSSTSNFEGNVIAKSLYIGSETNNNSVVTHGQLKDKTDQQDIKNSDFNTRISNLETYKTNHTNEFSNLQSAVSTNTSNIEEISAVYKGGVSPQIRFGSDTLTIQPVNGTIEITGNSAVAAKVRGNFEVSSNITAKGSVSGKDVSTTGSITAGSATINGSTTISGVTDIKNDTSVTGALNVSQNITSQTGYKVNNNFVPFVTIQENENDASFHTKKPIIHIGNEAPIPESNEIYIWVDTSSVIA